MISLRAIPWITLGLLLPAPAAAQQALSAGLRTPGVAVDTLVPGVRDQAAASTVTELLRGRAPGLNVLESSGVAGASPRLWIRGPGTVGLWDDPLVVVDGVRINADPDAFGSEFLAQSTSRLADLSPDDVASVRVLRGPAGAAAYGPEGASGVLEITTRREGGPRLHAWSALGVRQQATDFPLNYGRRGRTPLGDVYGTGIDDCTLRLERAGRCIPLQSGVSTTDPLAADSAFRTGVSTNVGVRLSGSAGGGRAGYLLSGATRRVEGTLHDNADALRHLRGALSFQAGGARLAVTAAHARRETDIPLTGTQAGGILGLGLTGSGVPAYTGGGWVPGTPPSIGEAARHTTLGASADYVVLPWLSVGARGGRDETDSDGGAVFGGTPASVYTEADERMRWHWSAHATARAVHAHGVRGALTAGLERLGSRHAFRARTERGPTYTQQEFMTRSRTRALFAHGTAQWRSLRVGGTVRGDRPDRGRDDETRLAYSLGGEWALDGTVPRGGWLRALTLRAAHGRVARGLEWIRTPVFVSCPISGCPPLPPLETATETEAGVDARLFGRVDLSVTGYLRRTNDLLGVHASPWGGASFVSGGEVHNRGVEVAAAVHGPENRAVAWRVDLAAAANRNEYRADEGAWFPAGSRTYHRDGYPLGSYFERRITGFADRDGDGILAGCADAATCEVQFSAEPEYAGTPTPDRLASLTGTLRVRRASLHVRADWAGGAELLDYTSAYRCAIRGNCAAAYDPSLPLEQQAEILAASVGRPGGFVRGADFARLREVAITVSTPDAWTAGLGGARVDFTLAGRNLATWTDYPGLDPETSAGGPSLFAAIDSFEQPLSRSIVTRIDVRF